MRDFCKQKRKCQKHDESNIKFKINTTTINQSSKLPYSKTKKKHHKTAILFIIDFCGFKILLCHFVENKQAELYM